MSWKVAGITASLLSSFLLNLSFHCPWSVFCLQEAFTKTEGLLSSSSLDGTDGHKHVVFTPKSVKRSLRAPAIVVRDSFAQNCVCNWFGTESGCVLFKKAAQNFRVTLQTPSRLVFDYFARSSSSVNAVSRPTSSLSVLTQMCN